jgi:glycosyltransferase involved in cell wall biosynthesis
LNRASVSVVIPCYCSKDTIFRALNSVTSQTLKPVEIIVVDDCSTDNTFEELVNFSNNCVDKIIIIKTEINMGAASARNVGWALATQPYVAFLDADDSWHPDKIRIQYEFMIDNPSVVLSGHQCVLFEVNNSCKIYLLENAGVVYISSRSMLFKSPFSTPSVMIKRDIPFHFEEGRRYAEDVFLWQKIAISGLNVIRLELPLAYVYKPFYGSTGLSSRLIDMERGELTNFLYLYKANKISFVLFILASFFSLVKFLRRLFFVKLNNINR